MGEAREFLEGGSIMASQSEVLRMIELFQHLGFNSDDVIRLTQFLEGKGSINDLVDLRDIAKRS